jgi:hypothetical protein
VNKIRTRICALEALEHRLCLSTSVGWDGPGQGSASLSYYIGSVPDSLDEPLVETTIEAASDVWSDVADIHFEETTRSGRPDSIDFRFTNIDGPGRTLARAYFPDDLNRNPIAGDVQFDAAENWEVGNGRGAAAFDLMLVAVHEIGHALGLDHSSAIDSVMRDAISALDSFAGLFDQDVRAILALYAPTQTPAAADDEPAAADPSETLSPPAALLPPSEPATPTDATPVVPPADETDDPALPNDPEDANPDTEDNPDDFTPNRFHRHGGWRRFPRIGGEFGPRLWPRIGQFPTRSLSRINRAFIAQSNHQVPVDAAPNSEPSQQADADPSVAGREAAPASEPDDSPRESHHATRHERRVFRRSPLLSAARPTSNSPMRSLARRSFPGRPGR